MKRPSRKSILFVMDPSEKILLEFDTSMSIMMEAIRRNHRVFYSEPHDLSLVNGKLCVESRSIQTLNRQKGFKFNAPKSLPVQMFDVIFIRKDPPVDVEYINMTYLLERASGNVLMINSPSGIRQANEKLFPFYFKGSTPPSIATSLETQILKFQNQINSDLILKPLNRKGGEGILLLRKKSGNKKSIIQKATHAGLETILAQKFIKRGISDGDRRILLWNGEILGGFGRVPKRGEYRSNLSLGGSMKKIEITKREQMIAQKLQPALAKLGLIFVGLDMIDGWVTEINVTSPAGIPEINDLYNKRIESRILDWLEKSI